jgi:hypothetical protein
MVAPDRTTHSVKFTNDGFDQSLFIDGIDMSGITRKVEFAFDANQLEIPTVHVTLISNKIEFETKAEVKAIVESIMAEDQEAIT